MAGEGKNDCAISDPENEISEEILQSMAEEAQKADFQQASQWPTTKGTIKALCYLVGILCCGVLFFSLQRMDEFYKCAIPPTEALPALVIPSMQYILTCTRPYDAPGYELVEAGSRSIDKCTMRVGQLREDSTMHYCTQRIVDEWHDEIEANYH